MATIVRAGGMVGEFRERSWSERNRSLRCYLIGVASGGVLVTLLVRLFG